MRVLFKLFFVIFCCCLLNACHKISQENFSKINTGMKMQEVVSILGEPTSSDSVNIAGVSGTAAVWKSNNAEIDIQFLNDKVFAKSYSTLDETSSPNK